MKKIIYLMSLACLVMFTACSSDDSENTVETNDTVKKELFTIGVGLPGNADTRAQFEKNDIQNLLWEADDMISAYSYVEGKIEHLGDLKIISGIGDKNATFSGEINTASDQMVFVYKGQYVTINNDCTVSMNYNGQSQNASGDLSSLKNYVALMSAPVAKDAAKKSVVTLSHKTAVFKINIKDFPSSIEQNKAVNVKMYLNHTQSSFLPTSQVFLSSGLKTGDNIIYMAVDPSKSLNVNGVIAVEIFDGGNYNLLGRAKATSSKSSVINYAPGKIYTLTVSDNTALSKALRWEKADPLAGYSDLYNYSFDSTPSPKLTAKDWSSGVKDFFKVDQTEGALIISPSISKTTANESVTYYVYISNRKRLNQTDDYKLVITQDFKGFKNNAVPAGTCQVGIGTGQDATTHFKMIKDCSSLDTNTPIIIDIPKEVRMSSSNTYIFFTFTYNKNLDKNSSWLIKSVALKHK